jgi:hypothetical protein
MTNGSQVSSCAIFVTKFIFAAERSSLCAIDSDCTRFIGTTSLILALTWFIRVPTVIY